MENKTSKLFTADQFKAKANPVIQQDQFADFDQLIKLQKQYETNFQLLKKKEEMISMTSHELKTPISTILLFLNLLEKLTEKEADHRVLELVQKAELQVERLVKLVNNLQDIDALQNGNVVLQKEIFNFSALLKGCVETFRLQNPAHQIIIKENTINDIYADPLRVEQVLINFISNAIKYSPGAVRIIINVERSLRTLKISVTDSGIGITKTALPQVFDHHFRAHADDNRFKGNGLGLYISKEIISQHDGEIGVESKENKGSTFWFSLPIHPDEI